MGYGFFAPIAKRLGIGLTVVLLCVTAPCAVSAEHPADGEGALLHRSFDLRSVRQWNRQTGIWQPIDLPRAKVYVVNLWAIDCKPCLSEFPQLRNVTAGWKSKPEVHFVFLADPPNETSEAQVVAFWQKNQNALPDGHPCRSTSDALRRGLDNDKEPLTLLLDENLIVRQAFIGAIGERPLGRSIERLLQATNVAESSRPHTKRHSN